MNDNDVLLKRINFLVDKAYNSSRYCYTDFLGLSQQEVFLACTDSYNYVENKLIGDQWDNDNRERRIIRFGSTEEFGYEEEIPIMCIKCEPLNKKFSDELSHRDFLGALINLGIERDVIGDIIVAENTAYIFVISRMSQFILDELTRVKRTNVKCNIVNDRPKEVEPKFEEIKLVVSSLRCDGIISKVLKLSRSLSIELFKQKRVFVNGRLIENNSINVKPKDVLVIRGFGKYIVGTEIKDTKKGRISVNINKQL